MTNGVIRPGSLIQLPIFTAYIDNDRRIGWLAIRLQVDLPEYNGVLNLKVSRYARSVALGANMHFLFLSVSKIRASFLTIIFYFHIEIIPFLFLSLFSFSLLCNMAMWK